MCNEFTAAIMLVNAFFRRLSASNVIALNKFAALNRP